MRTGGQRRSSNIERRGAGARSAALGGSAGIVLRLLFSRGGRRLLLPLIVIGVIAVVIFGPQRVFGFIAALTGGEPGGVAVSTLSEEQIAELEDRSLAILGSTEDVWSTVFSETGSRYREPTLTTYIGSTNTACGYGSAAAGPFYCPPDNRLYIDFSFFEQMDEQLGAPGDFAQAYVIAHEVGHHVQNLQGVLNWSSQAQAAAGGDAERNRIQVRVELMADCYAGVWAGRAQALSAIELEGGDLEEAIGAASAVGDDTLQRNAGRRATPDSFTHGSSDQRVRWFRRGYDSGDPAQCDTRETAYDRL